MSNGIIPNYAETKFPRMRKGQELDIPNFSSEAPFRHAVEMELAALINKLMAWSSCTGMTGWR